MGKLFRLLRFIPLVVADLWLMFVTYLPGRAGNLLRFRYYKRRLNYLGDGATIDVGTYIQNPQYVSIGENAWIDRNVIILAGPDKSDRAKRLISNDRFPLEKGRVHIGKNVHISPYCVISGIGGVYLSDECGLSAGVKVYSFSNHYRSDEQPADRTFHFGPLVGQDRQYMIEGPIFLDKNVGIALNAVILPGVSIGRDSFVAINSVVKVKSHFKENSLVAGSPAKRVGPRFEDH